MLQKNLLKHLPAHLSKDKVEKPEGSKIDAPLRTPSSSPHVQFGM